MFHRLTSIVMPNMGYQYEEVQQRDTCPLKKSGISIVFAKKSPTENCRLPKNSAPVDCDVANTAKQNANTAKQKANGSCKNTCRK